MCPPLSLDPVTCVQPYGETGMDWAWFGVTVAFGFALLPFLMFALRRLFEPPQARELAIIEEELKRPDLDPARRRELVDLVAGRLAECRPGTSAASRLMVAGGWVALIGGIAVATITQAWEVHDTAVFFAVAGGILMTLPFVLREWERRSGARNGAATSR